MGLGNPEPRYLRTPHNLGFMVLDELQRRWGIERRPDRRTRAEIAECRRVEKRIFLMAPLTYMNLSGQAVRPFCDYYEIPPANLIVICDDHDLPWGRIRLRAGGGTAGHKGLKSIEEHLGTDQFARLRIGIRPANPRLDLVEYVLAPFHEEAVELFGPMALTAADAVDTILDLGLREAMNRFNGLNLAANNGFLRSKQ